jgi:hypothetical protein
MLPFKFKALFSAFVLFIFIKLVTARKVIHFFKAKTHETDSTSNVVKNWIRSSRKNPKFLRAKRIYVEKTTKSWFKWLGKKKRI